MNIQKKTLKQYWQDFTVYLRDIFLILMVDYPTHIVISNTDSELTKNTMILVGDYCNL